MVGRKSVSSRILLAFVAVICLFGAAIGLSLLRLSQYNQAVNTVTQENLPRFEISNAWVLSTLQSAIHVRNMVGQEDSAKVHAEIAAVRQLRLKQQEYTESLSTILHSDEDKASLQDAIQASDAYAPLESDFLAKVDDPKAKDNLQEVIAHLKKAQFLYIGSTIKLNAKVKSDLKEEVGSLSGIYLRTRNLVLAIVACAAVIAALLAVWIARSIRRPLSQAVGVLAAIERGSYDTRVTVNTADEVGQVLSALDSMQRSLKNRIEAERSTAMENARIRTALDRVSSGAMLADDDGKIIYANEAVRLIFRNRQAEMGERYGNFDPDRIVGRAFDEFHTTPTSQRNMLATLQGSHKSDVKIGRAALRVVANPVVDAQGLRIGTVVEWFDRTQEVAAEEELQATVAKAIDGDLTVRLDESGKDGFLKSLSAGVNRLIANMSEAVRMMALAAQEVRTGADEISRGNMNLSQRTEEQASSLEQTAASMEQMTAAVKNNADNAAQAKQLVAAAREQAERGGRVVAAAVAAMSGINDASSKIADIIGVIDEIAFQTNLLALNAAVEAARAGEQGRGFAVVASEVRNLASRSAAAAKEIKSLIQDSVGKVTDGSRLVDESGSMLRHIVEDVKKVTDVVAEIAASSREQASGIDQVNKAVTAMDANTQQNAALVEEAAAAAQGLTQQAANLTQLIAQYAVGVQSGANLGSAASAGSGAIAAARAARRDSARMNPAKKRLDGDALPPARTSGSPVGAEHRDHDQRATHAPRKKASGDTDEWHDF